MYRTFARTSGEVFNRHPHEPTIRGLVGVMMCLNFLSFLRPLSALSSSSPRLFLILCLPPSNLLSLSLSLFAPRPSLSVPPLSISIYLSVPLSKFYVYLCSVPLSPSLLVPVVNTHIKRHNAYTCTYSHTSNRSLRCLLVMNNQYKVRIHAGIRMYNFDHDVHDAVCFVNSGQERRCMPSLRGQR